MDLPQNQITPTYISINSLWGGGTTNGSLLNLWNTSVAAAWPAANQAIYQPFSIPWPYYVNRAFWANGSAAGGNWDIGIYSIGGSRIWSKGSTVGSGNSALQYVAAGIWLTPGMYFLAVNHDAITASQAFGATTGVTVSAGRLVGFYQQAVGAIALPATATFAAWNSTFAPLCGITRT